MEGSWAVTDQTLLLALAPVLLLSVAFVVWVVVDIVRADTVRHLPRWAWIVISVISVPLGGIVYLLFGRDRGI
jgi:ABC-type tungstate transport system substrate-binding protein